MRSRQKGVAILAKNRNTINFFEKFFKSRRLYSASFYRNPQEFINHINENLPSALILESSFLLSVSDRITRFPSIAIISGDIKKGIELSINHNANRYIYRPYFERDLEQKLESIILEKDAYNKMQDEMRELETVLEVTQMITSSLDPKQILFMIVQKIAGIIPVTRCSIVRVDWLGKYAYVVATFEDPNITGIKLSLKKYPEIREALTSKKPVIIKDVSTDPLMKQVRGVLSPLGIRSILVMPVIFREKVIGTLFLRTSRTSHTFSENEIRLLNSIANASANALYNAFLFEQIEDEKTRLEKLAITDYLTGIYNIRYFYHRIIEEFSRCQRYGFPISCLMLDIDYFKKINDEYGHKIGDQVLKDFAQLLNRHTRKSDVLARYGGEEFIILLPQTSVEGALSEAERIRKYVKEHVFKSLRKKTVLTVSIGVAAFPNESIKTHDDLISCADDALFSAKEKGRNLSVVYDK